MLDLSAKNVRLNLSASTKAEAIRLVAEALVVNGNVSEGYQAGMFAREEQTSTFLGNGIAIPHGTLDTRDLVQQTGVQICQFPQGVEWGEGNIAYVVIGIAAKSDEHLSILRQLTTVLGDETLADKLAKTEDLDEFIAVFQGKNRLPAFSPELVSLNVESSSLVTLSAFNTSKLFENGYVKQKFISKAIKYAPLALGDDVFLNDSAKNNLENGIAVARNQQGKTLITVSAVDDSLNPVLAKLLDANFRQQLKVASVAQIVALLGGQAVENAENMANSAPQSPPCNGNQVVGTFTVRNEHGLHARPCAVLVQTLKPFEAKVTVENLDRPSAPVNAKSTMRVVGLGAVKGHRLRFVAEGADALSALETLRQAFIDGLGESVSFVPAEEDRIETAQAVETVEKSATAIPTNTGELEATFTVKNEHGLHARPSAVLVNEVKKHNATVQVQNLDRNSALVSAKSLMKIVALGVQKGHRLRFVATGEEAEKALAGIGDAIASGLGE